MNSQTLNISKHTKSGRSPIWFAFWLAWLAAVVVRSSAAPPVDTSFRVGFTHTLFTDVNENDAKAAVKAWSQCIAKERNIPTDPETRIFQSTPELLQALQAKLVDAVGITAEEYAAVSPEVRLAPLFVTYNGGRCREQYLLLVHRDGQLDHLSDLRGKTLIFHANSRSSLAQPWLDTLLIENGNKPAGQWLGETTQTPKLAQVILPVFFRKVDACVATRTEFETMCELNPQIGQQLKILARSPELVSSVFCFRADYAPVFKERLFDGLRDLHQTAAGLQVLTIFQSEKVEEQPASCFASALELLARHANHDTAMNTQPPSEPPQPVSKPNP